MILSFHPCFDADIQIILGSRSLNKEDNQLISSADAIILPQAAPENLYQASLKSGAYIFPDYAMRLKYPGKIGQNQMFAFYNLPKPRLFVWKNVQSFKNRFPELKESPFPYPFFIKDNLSHEGNGVFYVSDRPSLLQALEKMIIQEESHFDGFITQESISSYGNVLRVVIIGEKIISYWKRPEFDGQTITTISRGAIIDRKWMPELKEKGELYSVILSKKTGINLAAIDFVFPLEDKDPEPLFLEINYYFGRRGLGGSIEYYKLLYGAIQAWVTLIGLNPKKIKLI